MFYFGSVLTVICFYFGSVLTVICFILDLF